MLGHGWDERLVRRRRRPPTPRGAGPGRRRPPGLPDPGRRALGAGLQRAGRRGPGPPAWPDTGPTAPLRQAAHHGVRALALAGMTAGPAGRRPTGVAAPGPPRSASARSTSAAGRPSPARRTSPGCSNWPERGRAVRVRLLGRTGRPGEVPGPGRASAPAATCSSTARSARTPPPARTLRRRSADRPRPTAPTGPGSLPEVGELAAFLVTCVEAGRAGRAST